MKLRRQRIAGASAPTHDREQDQSPDERRDEQTRDREKLPIRCERGRLRGSRPHGHDLNVHARTIPRLSAQLPGRCDTHAVSCDSGASAGLRRRHFLGVGVDAVRRAAGRLLRSARGEQRMAAARRAPRRRGSDVRDVPAWDSGASRWDRTGRRACESARRSARAMLVLTLFCAFGSSASRCAIGATRTSHRHATPSGRSTTSSPGRIWRTSSRASCCCSRSRSSCGAARSPRDRHAGVEAIAYYWHFVFVVWLALWATIFSRPVSDLRRSSSAILAALGALAAAALHANPHGARAPRRCSRSSRLGAAAAALAVALHAPDDLTEPRHSPARPILRRFRRTRSPAAPSSGGCGGSPRRRSRWRGSPRSSRSPAGRTQRETAWRAACGW